MSAIAATGTSTIAIVANLPGRGNAGRRVSARAVMAAECARVARATQAASRAARNLVVPMDREALGIAAELEAGRVAGEVVGAVRVVEPLRRAVGDEAASAHRITHDAAPA